MRLGLSSFACAWAIGVPGQLPAKPLDAAGLIALATALGVKVVQLADNLKVADYDVVRDTAERHGIAIELGTRGIDTAHLRNQIALCKQLGSRFLRVVVDTFDREPSPAEIVTAFREVLPDLHAAGVNLGIENHDRFSAATFADIIERVDDSWVGICLDTVNSFGALEGPEVVVKTLSAYVLNLHLKDFVIRRAWHTMGFEIIGAPAGSGRLDIPWLLSELRKAGRDLNVIIEHWPEPEATLAETIAKERRWCEMSVQHMRALIPS
jgi:sugar phosphate isomerase/epimerase